MVGADHVNKKKYTSSSFEDVAQQQPILQDVGLRARQFLGVDGLAIDVGEQAGAIADAGVRATVGLAAGAEQGEEVDGVALAATGGQKAVEQELFGPRSEGRRRSTEPAPGPCSN